MATAPLVHVVDDDPGMRQTLIDILSLARIAAEDFGSGAAVLAAANGSHRPGLALLDHRLPDTSGIELATKLKAQDPDLAVVLLTGYVSTETAIAAVGLVDDYLIKPVPPDDLLKSVRAGLDRTRLRRENRDLISRLEQLNTSLEQTVADRTRELQAAHEQALADQAIREKLQSQAEKERLERRLHQAQRLESLGQLAGGIAHDFNNLLSVILNYAALVAEQTADDHTVAADVERICAAADRAARLTKQLLVVGRREAVATEILDINVVVTDIHSLLARSIGGHVELTISAAQHLPAIRADRGQIEQVLLNLAVNARDAMPDGGALVIETKPTDLDDRYIGSADIPPGSYVELAVSDNGAGMSAEVAKHAFEPFFTTKPKGEGTGLGLATIYGIVTEAGGTVSLYSEVGTGTTVRVLFPAVQETATPTTEPRQPHPATGRGETILVVDDEPAILTVTARLLRSNGYVVIEAATPADALALADNHEPQLLLTDVVMPRMSGQELATRLQTARPHLPVLFMSGYSHGILARQGLPNDNLALIQKPFNEKTLLIGVRDAIDGRTHTVALAGAERTPPTHR